MAIQRTLHTIPKSLSGERLDRALEVLIPDLSRSQLQKLVRRGQVRVGGKVIVRSNGRVQKGAEVQLEREAPAPKIVVLHEDEDLLVVTKPPGLLTHGVSGGPTEPDLAREMDQRFGPLPTSRGLERPGIVHRLDRETSGVLVLARSERALETLQDQFRERTVLKIYLALCSGTPSEQSFTLQDPMGPVEGKKDRQGIDQERGKDAQTGISVAQGFGSHSLLACTLHTGRRHQIRVHLAAHGHPVMGDPLYGTKDQRPLPLGIPHPPRLFLHAQTLAFDHPTTGERVSFESELPADLAPTVAALRQLRDQL